MDQPVLAEKMLNNQAYQDFMMHVSRIPDLARSDGYVYILVLYDASTPVRTIRQFIVEDQMYVGFATDLATRATTHRKDYLCSMRYRHPTKTTVS